MKAAPILVGSMVLGTLSVSAAQPPPVKSVEIRNEGLFVNGEPFFPVGIGWVAHWHFSLPEAGEKGFNLATTHGLSGDPLTFRADIDDAYANGMYAAASVGNGVWEDLKQLERIVLACRDAPGLLVWELEDEPNHPKDPYRVPPEKLKPAYELIRRLDPVHPVWLNLACGRLKDHQDYRDIADIHSDDTYPVPVASVTTVAQYSDSVVDGSGKLGWMWVQMAPLRGGETDRAPTMAEVRCMTYMAVAHGISGVLYFSFHYGGEGWEWWVTDSPAAWTQWSDLTAELHRLTPYLVAPQAPGQVTAESTDGAGDAATALHLSLRRTKGGYFLIAVNGSTSTVKARITVPVTGVTPQAAVRSENRLINVEDGSLEDTFAPHEVHLYELPFSVDKVDRRSVSWPRWQRRARP